MPDGPAAPRWGRAVAGALAGATVWLSAGTLAVVDAQTLTRVGTLPHPLGLAVAVAVGAVVGAWWRVPGTTLAPLAATACLWLPWLPLRVPVAFLMWEGPLELAVWGAAIGGMLARLMPWAAIGASRWTSPPRAPIVAGLAAAALLAGAWAGVRPRVPAGDEPHYLVITQSLLTDADLRIENNHRQEQYLDYYDGELRPDFVRRGVDGQIYSIHAPGVAAVVLPAFAVAGYGGAVATVVAICAAGTAAAWLAAYWLTQRAGAAWAAWAALVAAAPFLLHGFTIYPDPVGAAAAAAGMLALVVLDTGAAGLSARAWAGLGAALAGLPWLHTRFALVAAVLGVAIIARLARRPRNGTALAAFLIVPAVAAAAWFTYFWRIYGTLSPAAPYGARPEGGLGFVPTGLVGLLVDQQFGLIANAPVLLAGLVGLVPLARRHPRLTAELAAVLLSYLAAVSTYPMWWAGYSASGRFAVVVLPLLTLPLAAWWSAGPVGRWTVGVLTGVSAAISATLVLHDRGSLIYNGRDGHALLFDWLSPTVDLTLGLPSVHRDGAAVAAGDAAVWGLAGAVAIGLATLAGRRWRGSVAVVARAGAAPLAAMIALPVVWAGRDRPAATPPTSQMALLDRWAPPVRPVGVGLTPTRALDLDGVVQRMSLSTSLRGHRAPGVSPLLRIPLVPAGEFDVIVEGRSWLAGVATVRLGREDLPMETWALDGRPAGFTGLTLRLPAIAHSIAITGDDAARATVRRLTLRPRLLPAPESTQPHALRAARYGNVVVFALDDNAFLEPGALWVRGERTFRLIVQADDPGRAVLRLIGGPVANTVTLAAPGWMTEVRLGPEERRDLTVPAAALAPAVLAVTSATGFRPSEHAPGNGDARWLGVYLTWP
jgi:hypothetical protein